MVSKCRSSPQRAPKALRCNQKDQGAGHEQQVDWLCEVTVEQRLVRLMSLGICSGENQEQSSSIPLVFSRVEFPPAIPCVPPALSLTLFLSCSFCTSAIICKTTTENDLHK